MAQPTPILRDLSTLQRSEVLRAAADALRDGRAAVLPTDSVYNVAITARFAESDRLRSALAERIAPEGFPGLFARACSSLAARYPAHRLLIRRLVPGPVAFLARPEDLDMPADAPGFPPGFFEPAGPLDAGTVAFRVLAPGTPASELVRLAGAPVAVAEIPLSPGRWATEPGVAGQIVAEAAGEAPTVLDGGALRPGRPCTLVWLRSGGGYSIVRPGAYEERFVHKQMEQTVLFVCSGNTCRSPMAEAIAAHLVATGRPGPFRIRVASAGTGAHSGAPATPEAVKAVRQVGADPSVLHGSRPLTRALIDQADVIYVMTRSHERAVASMAPGAAAKVQLVDPAGNEIPDPIGFPQEIYTDTADRLKDAIEKRLKEMNG